MNKYPSPETVSAREAKEILSELRFLHKTKQIEADEAHKIGKPYVEVYNAKAKEIAKKFGVKAKTLPNNLIFW